MSEAYDNTIGARPYGWVGLALSLVAIVVGLIRNAIVTACGTSSRRSSSRFAIRVPEKKVTPVTLPPGRLMLATRPSETGSLPLANTIGMVAVAAFAAWGEFAVPNA